MGFQLATLEIPKARNIQTRTQQDRSESDDFALSEAKQRLGLSQAQLAKALNVNRANFAKIGRPEREPAQMAKRTKDLRELLPRMDDYVVAPTEKDWLSTQLEAFAGRSPRQLITEGRIRDLVIEFDRLREGQPV